MRLFLVLAVAIALAGGAWYLGLGPKTSEKNTQRFAAVHYQLQKTEYANLRKLSVDLLVLDLDDARLSRRELLDLKSSGKTVLSYLSIGEAERYRDYWQPDWRTGHPSFVDAANLDWKDNFKVRYWQDEWQNIIFAQVKKIARAGYDGAYLDIIDAYEYYQERGRETARKEMIDFVRKIRNEGKNINPDFMIVPQNSTELYEFEDYRNTIDGLGTEDTWYNGNTEQNASETERVLKFLDQAAKDGKFVLAIDYPTQQRNICDFYKKCQSHGFACTVAGRNLDQTEPVQCDALPQNRRE